MFVIIMVFILNIIRSGGQNKLSYIVFIPSTISLAMVKNGIRKLRFIDCHNIRYLKKKIPSRLSNNIENSRNIVRY